MKSLKIKIIFSLKNFALQKYSLPGISYIFDSSIFDTLINILNLFNMKKVVLLSCLITSAVSVYAGDFSDLSIGSKIVSLVIFIIIAGTFTSPIWGLIWYFVWKWKKGKERKEWRKAYYAKQLEEKRKIELNDLERLKKVEEHKEWRKAYYAEQLEEKRKIESKGLERLKKVEELTEQKSEIIEFELAGLYYRPKKAHEVAGRLNVGNSLELKRNPSNEYDEYAVKVFANGTHIGFIPQNYSEEVSTKIKKGNGYRVYVSSTDKGNIPHIYLKLFPFELHNLVLYDFD